MESFFCANFLYFPLSLWELSVSESCLLISNAIWYSITQIHHYLLNYILLENTHPSSQGYGFSSGHVWMWQLDCADSWAPKNWCFWTVVLEKTLGSPLDCKEFQESTLKEISSEYLLEGPMLKLKLQYFGHLVDSLEKTLILEEIGGRRRREWQGTRWLQVTGVQTCALPICLLQHHNSKASILRSSAFFMV